ncbi:MAG: Lrp/AsnC family transcriptional regulator [Chloroflexi bacterium]|nr:Lrp/AsnC family transcriptional regulator [Chloroflexota bacterium]
MKDVLQVLEQDARATPEQIAAMTGRSADEVRDIVRAAEADRTIVRYRTVVNWEKTGEEQVWALIEVKVTPQRDVGFDSIAERIARFPEVWSVSLASGDFDLVVMVVGRTMQEVSAFVSGKLAPLAPVQGTNTHFLLKRYKEDGVILEGDEQPQRLPVAP